ncbi:MAG: bifunctional glutamate N-acetyltransferase/amino-acid acetyltransferase ArgJ [Nitrospinae bacterium]|nr:bifunctional glutamate N-acetyltransferase/amino-acid acetyltransferase ArgJ [Nitrospinota bacterium]
MKEIKGGITAVRGIRASGISCGIKKTGKKDLALIVSEAEASAAGVFTENRVKAAPVILSQKNIKNGRARGVIVNSGNANACTGNTGYRHAGEMMNLTAKSLGVSPEKILVASTGVIGDPLPIEKIKKGIPVLVKKLSKAGGIDAAEAIMTTDIVPKITAVEYKYGRESIRIGGIAKGSGMIYPRLATMLAFITTDIAISPKLLNSALKESVDKSFNMITVDGDTSTNDTVLVLANGLAGNKMIANRNSKEFALFVEALNHVTTALSKMIVKDGEGATKFVEINVKKAKNFEDAKKIALSIANSNLVKTALFGEDPNWGRVVSAAGNSGVKFDPDKIRVSIGEVVVFKNGSGVKVDWERKVRGVMRERDITITLDLGIGHEDAKVWTTDLSYDYVKINGSYRS